VPKGRALAEAKALALELARFPQVCMRGDRRSAHEQWSLNLEAALKHEGRTGLEALGAEALQGARGFSSRRDSRSSR